MKIDGKLVFTVSFMIYNKKARVLANVRLTRLTLG